MTFKCHRALPDPDGIYGVKHGNDIHTLAQVYAHGGQWSRAAHAFDSVLNSIKPDTTSHNHTNINNNNNSNSSSNSGGSTTSDEVYRQLATSMHKQGLHSTLQTFMEGHSRNASSTTRTTTTSSSSSSSSSWITERTLEALWRTTQWESTLDVSSITVPTNSNNNNSMNMKRTSSSFHDLLCRYLRSLVLDDDDIVIARSNQLRTCILTEFVRSQSELTTINNISFIHRLRFGADVYAITNTILNLVPNSTASTASSTASARSSLTNMLDTWSLESGPLSISSTNISSTEREEEGSEGDATSFEEMEPLLALRTALLRACLSTTSQTSKGKKSGKSNEQM